MPECGFRRKDGTFTDEGFFEERELTPEEEKQERVNFYKRCLADGDPEEEASAVLQEGDLE